MANQIKTRIQLKYDSYSNWTTVNPVLLAGEIAIATIASGDTQKVNSVTAPQSLIKVGDGTSNYNSLPFISALAADVYSWAKAEKAPDEIDTRYAFEMVEGALQVTETKYINEVAQTPVVKTFDFVTPAELEAILADYYTKEEVDNLIQGVNDKIDGLDESVTTLTHGTGITVTDNGEGNDHAYTVALNAAGAKTALGLDAEGIAAYVTVESLNATAKGYADAVEAKIPTELGVMSVSKGDDTITIGGTAANPTIAVTANKFDAYGAAAAVLGEANDGAAANTVYGAKAAAAAAQSDATIAKTKIETFLGTITPDGSQDIIDTLTEINNYVGEHGEEFAALSEKVTKIENGTTTVPKASDANTLDGKHADAFADATENGAKALAQGVKDVVDANKEIWDKAATAAQAADLAKVATSGSYNDLENLPTLGALAAKDTVETADIADKNVTEAKLEQNVQDALALARTALQDHQDISGKKDRQEPIADPTATAAEDNKNFEFIDSISQNENGEIAATKKSVTLGDLATKNKVGLEDLVDDVFFFYCGSATEVMETPKA